MVLPLEDITIVPLPWMVPGTSNPAVTDARLANHEPILERG